MLTEQIVSLLIQERDKLDRAIQALGGGAKRRGRPPKKGPAIELISGAGNLVAQKKKRRFTPAQRKAFGDRMKAYWAKKRNAAKG